MATRHGAAAFNPDNAAGRGLFHWTFVQSARATMLTVTGTEGNDVMSVVRVGIDDVQVTVNALTRRFDMDDVHTYSMLGLGGDDRMTKTGRVHRRRGPGLHMNGGEGNDTVRGTELIIRGAETVHDESGRIVAEPRLRQRRPARVRHARATT